MTAACCTRKESFEAWLHAWLRHFLSSSINNFHWESFINGVTALRNGVKDSVSVLVVKRVTNWVKNQKSRDVVYGQHLGKLFKINIKGGVKVFASF